MAKGVLGPPKFKNPCIKTTVQKTSHVFLVTARCSGHLEKWKGVRLRTPQHLLISLWVSMKEQPPAFTEQTSLKAGD